MASGVGTCRRRIVTPTDSPRPPAQAKTQAAKAKIDALFSGEAGNSRTETATAPSMARGPRLGPIADPARDKLDALFGGQPKKPS